MNTKSVKRPAVTVPRDENDAAAFVGCIGTLKRNIESIQADTDEKIKNLKLEAANKIEPINQEIEKLFTGLYVFAEANREKLAGDKTKTIKLATGSISWHMTPPKVAISNIKKVLAALKKLGLERFIRKVEEPDKEAMLKEKEAVKSVKGIKIEQHEEFIVKPDTWETEIITRTDALSKRIG
jgi:phage host-nuclease inhibitor protein Gam